VLNEWDVYRYPQKLKKHVIKVNSKINVN